MIPIAGARFLALAILLAVLVSSSGATLQHPMPDHIQSTKSIRFLVPGRRSPHFPSSGLGLGSRLFSPRVYRLDWLRACRDLLSPGLELEGAEGLLAQA